MGGSLISRIITSQYSKCPILNKTYKEMEKYGPLIGKKKRLTEIIPKEAQHTKNKDFNSPKYALWKKPLIKKKKKKLRKLGKYMKE